jgi:hypothetical protein
MATVIEEHEVNWKKQWRFPGSQTNYNKQVTLEKAVEISRFSNKLQQTGNTEKSSGDFQVLKQTTTNR